MELQIQSGEVLLPGELTIPEGASGLVVFAHGSGSSRHSPRNRYVAEVLHQAHVATLLFDLLTLDEERAEKMSAHLRFDVELLAQRLMSATTALMSAPRTHHLPIGYFGSETGCAAALMAAAEHPDQAMAIVGRGGRPDLAAPVLGSVQTPTLLIVGEHDKAVLSVNRQAITEIPARAELRTITGASHLFEEPGALDRVANLARDWFELHLTSAHLGRR